MKHTEDDMFAGLKAKVLKQRARELLSRAAFDKDPIEQEKARQRVDALCASSKKFLAQCRSLVKEMERKKAAGEPYEKFWQSTFWDMPTRSRLITKPFAP